MPFVKTRQLVPSLSTLLGGLCRLPRSGFFLLPPVPTPGNHSLDVRMAQDPITKLTILYETFM